MQNMMDELKDMGLHLVESDSPMREKIDFMLTDGEDNVAYVWGISPDNVDWECNHPEVEFDKDEPIGECALCGCYCNTLRERDGSLVPNGWFPRKTVGGWLGRYLEELKEEKRNGSK